MNQSLYAVITGDIRNSTRLPSDDLFRLPQVLKGIFNELNLYLEKKELWVRYSIYRGDSFQMLTPPLAAIEAVLFVRAGLRVAYPRVVSAAVDCRTAIAIGTVGHLSEQITESSGEAFNLSGHLLESMGKSAFMKSVAPSLSFTAELNTELALCNELVARWTHTQANLIPKLFNGETQTTIAAGTGTSQAAVTRKLQTMGWPAVEQFLLRYRMLCELH